MNKQKARLLCMDLALALLLIAFDQFTKQLAVDRLKGQPSFPLIRGVLELHYLENTGSAFGLLQGQRVFLLAVGVLFLVAALFFLIRLPVERKFFAIHLLVSGVIAGGLGNMADRFRLGYVIDFIYFALIDFPIFNVADCYVVVSAILFFIIVFFLYQDEDTERMIGWKSGKKS